MGMGPGKPVFILSLCALSAWESNLKIDVHTEGIFLGNKRDRAFTLYLSVFRAYISAVAPHHKNRRRVRKRYRTIS